MISHRILTALACVLLSGPSLRALTVSSEATAAWAENIGRATADINWRDAMRFETRTEVSFLREWRAGFMTVGRIDAGIEHVPDFSKMDAFTGGLATTFRQKFGLGALAPVASLDLGLRRREARLAADDGWLATAGLRLSRRVTESWRLSAVTDWRQHYARSAIFDTRHHRVFATVAWDLTDWLQLAHGNGRLWGDFTANAGPSIWPLALAGALGPDVSNYYNTTAWGVTELLGPGWVTYRVSGRVSFWWLELAPALGRNTSLPLRYESLFSVNKVGIKYRQDVWTLQLLYRF